jgi:hypothetical protein
VIEIRPPFSPDQATGNIAAVFRADRVTRVTGDRFGGEWAVAFAAEKQAERQTLAKRSQQKAAGHIQRAIVADEANAAALTIPINHNPTPNAA